MFTYRPALAVDEGAGSLAEAFRIMRQTMEQSPDWRPLPLPETPRSPRGARRTTCAERTAIAKKAAAARWAKRREPDAAHG
jgi:hypothetical protein